MRLPKIDLQNQRGMTLIELMIVVAIVGILASVAGVSYVKYIKSAKIGKLKQYAMEIANAQEQYKSQNSHYLSPGTSYATTDAKWTKLLGFTKTVESNITIDTQGGASTDTCSICETSSRAFGQMWYAVRITQDMNEDVTGDTTVYLHSELAQPLVINEGK